MEPKRTIEPQAFYLSLRSYSDNPRATAWNFFYNVNYLLRVPIEIFVRRNFGQRYFQLRDAFNVAVIILYVLPAIWARFSSLPQVLQYGILGTGPSQAATGEGIAQRNHAFIDDTVLLLFLSALVFRAWRHHRSMKRAPSTFDFAKYSWYNGDLHPFLLNLGWRGKKLSRRTIECWAVPTLFFVAGMVLAILQLKLGWYLMISAYMYSLGYRRAHRANDNFILDKIDQRIVNEELAKVLLDDKAAPSQTRWFDPPVHLPADPEQRQQVRDMVLADADEAPLAK